MTPDAPLSFLARAFLKQDRIRTYQDQDRKAVMTDDSKNDKTKMMAEGTTYKKASRPLDTCLQISSWRGTSSSMPAASAEVRWCVSSIISTTPRAPARFPLPEHARGSKKGTHQCIELSQRDQCPGVPPTTGTAASEWDQYLSRRAAEVHVVRHGGTAGTKGIRYDVVRVGSISMSEEEESRSGNNIDNLEDDS